MAILTEMKIWVATKIFSLNPTSQNQYIVKESIAKGIVMKI